MITKKRWTDEENNILVQAITANPHNIKEACRYAATKLEGRTSNACYRHWYHVIAPANNPTKLGGSSTVQPEKNALWARIKKLIGLK